MRSTKLNLTQCNLSIIAVNPEPLIKTNLGITKLKLTRKWSSQSNHGIIALNPFLIR